ncbi:transcription initiation factor IID, 31kD subunit-domain-containing protein [Lactarius hatsudake]|nr:transcription initiation factor IID, 31kD subunit-domain-containing protein [Lactarius hatsudake]
MSRPSTESLPPAARAIALLLASTPTVQDAQPGVLHQLLEFSHRYTAQVLSDALVYAEHAGRPNKLEMDDVTLAVQARVGWEFGGRVPKEYTLSLATQVNAQSLPPVPEVFGLRLPPVNECLTAVDFDLVPNRPPPEEKQFDEEIEEIVESASEDEDEDMEPAAIPPAASPPHPPVVIPPPLIANPVNAVHTPSEDVDMVDTSAAVPNEVEEGSDEDDGLFAGGEESGADETMEEVTAGAEDQADGVKRKLVEEDDYD